MGKVSKNVLEIKLAIPTEILEYPGRFLKKFFQILKLLRKNVGGILKKLWRS